MANLEDLMRSFDNENEEETIQLIKYYLKFIDKYFFEAHPLGFYYCKLAEMDNLRLRIHFWKSNSPCLQSKDLLIHSHDFALWSIVLLGEIRNITYKIRKLDKSHIEQSTHNKYNVNYIGKRSVLEIEKNERFVIDSCKTEVLSQNQIYNVREGILHKTEILSPVAITVVLNKFFMEKKYASVLIPSSSSRIMETHDYNRSNIKNDELLFISNMINSLNNNSPNNAPPTTPTGC